MSAIAEFWASMSFKVDSSGLTAFRTEMALVKSSMGETLEVLHKTSKALKSVLKQFETVQGSFDAGKMTDWRKRIAAAARAYVKVMEASNGVLHQVAQEASKSQIKLSNFEKRLNSNIVALNSYAQALMPVVLLLERLRGAAGSPLPRVGGGFRGGANGAGGAGSGGHGGAGRPPSGAGTGLLETAGIMAFLKPMLPMGMGLGGMLGGGYAFRELIGAGREMFAMELKMKAVSKSSEAFANNMKFVRELSQQLGLDLVGAGNAYAQIVVTAQEKMNPESMQKMFTGFNKYYATVHMTAEDQRLANLAIQQMFGKDKIQAQEARLQMGQRVTPFIKLLTEAAKEKLGDKFTTFDDVMKRGLLDPATLLPVVADKLTIIANTGGALAEALENSQVAQIRFNNSLKEFSYIVMKGGLDHALAVMFAYGSEAVPMAAKAIKGLMHSVSNLVSFTFVALTDLKTWIAVALTGSLVTLAYAFTAAGGSAVVAATLAQIAFFNLKAVIVSVGTAIATAAAPLALFVAGAASLSEFLDILSGKDVDDSWLLTIDLAFALIISNMRVWMSDFEVWLAKIADTKFNWLPDWMHSDRSRRAGDDSQTNKATESLLGARRSDSSQIAANIKAFEEKYGTPQISGAQVSQPITVNITLPVTAAESAMIRNGDMSGLGTSIGKTVSSEISSYTPSVH
jgi:hypothetical protein